MAISFTFFHHSPFRPYTFPMDTDMAFLRGPASITVYFGDSLASIRWEIYGVGFAVCLLGFYWIAVSSYWLFSQYIFLYFLIASSSYQVKSDIIVRIQVYIVGSLNRDLMSWHHFISPPVFDLFFIFLLSPSSLLNLSSRPSRLYCFAQAKSAVLGCDNLRSAIVVLLCSVKVNPTARLLR